MRPGEGPPGGWALPINAVALAVVAFLLVAPAALARRGALSPGRWLLVALFGLVAGGMLLALCHAGSAGAGADPGDRGALAFLGALAGACLVGVPGAILAAALHRPGGRR